MKAGQVLRWYVACDASARDGMVGSGCSLRDVPQRPFHESDAPARSGGAVAERLHATGRRWEKSRRRLLLWARKRATRSERALQQVDQERDQRRVGGRHRIVAQILRPHPFQRLMLA